MLAGVPWLLWRRRDAIGVVTAAVKSGLQAAASLCCRTAPMYHATLNALKQDDKIDAFEPIRQQECRLRRDCGVESNTRASLISIYESGDSYVSTGCNTRVTTNDSKKGWNRSWRFRASVSIHILGHAANRKTRRHRAHLHPRKARTAAKVPYTQRDQQFGKKSPQKASLTQKAQGC